MNADLWAMGIILYELFTGKLPFHPHASEESTAAQEIEIRDKIIKAEIPNEISLIPEPWQGYVQRCLKKDAKVRLQSIEELMGTMVKESRAEDKTRLMVASTEDKTMILESVATQPKEKIIQKDCKSTDSKWKVGALILVSALILIFIYFTTKTNDDKNNSNDHSNIGATEQTDQQYLTDPKAEDAKVIDPDPPKNEIQPTPSKAQHTKPIQQPSGVAQTAPTESKPTSQNNKPIQKPSSVAQTAPIQTKPIAQNQNVTQQTGNPSYSSSNSSSPSTTHVSDGLTELQRRILKEIADNLVYVAGGSYMMGCNEGDSDCEDNEKPRHEETVSSFKLSKYELTQEQWEVIMGSNPSANKGCNRCPVETVSWEEVQAFIRKLNKLSIKSYRLPSEVEWEFAARGGNRSKGYIYSGSNNLNSIAWASKNYEAKTHPVGGKTSNELGLYDVSGNVSEWCQDNISDNYDSPIRKSKHPVFRGGSKFQYIIKSYRVSERGRAYYTNPIGDIGFRLASGT